MVQDSRHRKGKDPDRFREVSLRSFGTSFPVRRKSADLTQTTGLAARSEADCGLPLRNTYSWQITDGQQITDSRQTADNRQKQITQQADNRRDTIQITDNRQRAEKGGSHGVND